MADEENDISIIPAQPGFDVLVYKAETHEYLALPVVAWAVLTDDEAFIRAFPVTPAESWHLNDNLSVRLPTGEIVCDDIEWSCINEWLDFCRDHGADTPPIKQPEGDGARVLALDAFRNKFKATNDNGL